MPGLFWFVVYGHNGDVCPERSPSGVRSTIIRPYIDGPIHDGLPMTVTAPSMTNPSMMTPPSTTVRVPFEGPFEDVISSYGARPLWRSIWRRHLLLWCTLQRQHILWRWLPSTTAPLDRVHRNNSCLLDKSLLTMWQSAITITFQSTLSTLCS